MKIKEEQEKLKQEITSLFDRIQDKIGIEIINIDIGTVSIEKVGDVSSILIKNIEVKLGVQNTKKGEK